MKNKLKAVLRSLIHTCTSWILLYTKDEKTLSLCVSEFISQGINLKDANNAWFIVKYIREALAPTVCNLTEIKKSQDNENPGFAKFERLLEALRGMPPLPSSVIHEQVKMGDTFLGNHSSSYSGDVAWHFETSSSLAKKGRILYTITRFMRPKIILEVGTAYGMSGTVLMCAIEKYSPLGQLWTIEADEQQFHLASEQLQNRFPEKVFCIQGLSSEMLAWVVKEAGQVDLFFHDGGHSKDDYINDFGVVVDSLSPGSIVIIDDINWFDTRFVNSDPECYVGWKNVVAHPRAEWAVEIDSSIGLVLIN